jgi:hypothetical protein
MKYHGAQFRMARAATGLPTRTVCERASMSMRTLQNVEQAEWIAYGQKKQDHFAPETIEKLVRVYEVEGIIFLPPSAGAIGIRYAAAR